MAGAGGLVLDELEEPFDGRCLCPLGEDCQSRDCGQLGADHAFADGLTDAGLEALLADES